MTKVVLPTREAPKKSEHLLPLIEDVELYKLDKTNSVSWELSTQPGTADAPRYKFQVRILQGDETARQMIRWRLDVCKICIGLHVATLGTKKPIMEACMRPGPLSAFHSALSVMAGQAYTTALEAALQTDIADGDTVASDAVRGHGKEHYQHVDHLQAALNLVITSYLPRKILPRVKRNMRRDMRKPKDMTVRNYFQSVQRMNAEELPNLPPFGNAQGLSQDELVDIVLFGTPKSWQGEMERQGFDPMEHQLFEVVDFMENIEAVEDKFPTSNKSTKVDSKKKSSSSSSSSQKKKATHYCKEHGPNYTHDTSECKVLKNKASGKTYGNKTWVRKADSSNNSSKKELAAFINKEVKKGVKKQLASVDKKRKSDSDSEEGECFLLDSLTKNLDGFNYEAMDKLSIDDDASDEVSC